MNNSKKLEISKNDISIKKDIPSQYEKAEKYYDVALYIR